MVAEPESGSRNPVIIFIVVDFPAPLGPRNPSTSPRITFSETPSTALILPKLFLSASASINAVICSHLSIRGTATAGTGRDALVIALEQEIPFLASLELTAGIRANDRRQCH